MLNLGLVCINHQLHLVILGLGMFSYPGVSSHYGVHCELFSKFMGLMLVIVY